MHLCLIADFHFYTWSLSATGAADDEIVFTADDEEILEAFCVEAATIIHRFLIDAIVKQVDVADRASVASLLDQARCLCVWV